MIWEDKDFSEVGSRFISSLEGPTWTPLGITPSSRSNSAQKMRKTSNDPDLNTLYLLLSSLLIFIDTFS